MSSETVFQKRQRVILSGLRKSLKTRDDSEKKEMGAYISIAATSSAIEDENKALRLLRLLDQLMN